MNNTPQMMPTPEHLAPYETAAKLYCGASGIDPNQGMQMPHPTLAGMAVTFPRWYSVAENMLDLNRMLAAMKLANEQKATGVEGPRVLVS